MIPSLTPAIPYASSTPLQLYPTPLPIPTTLPSLPSLPLTLSVLLRSSPHCPCPYPYCPAPTPTAPAPKSGGLVCTVAAGFDLRTRRLFSMTAPGSRGSVST